jgi:hypothetical protein
MEKLFLILLKINCRKAILSQEEILFLNIELTAAWRN